MDDDNEDDDDDCKHEENVDITEELTTLPLVTWVVLAGIFNGQPPQGDQDHRKLFCHYVQNHRIVPPPKVIKIIVQIPANNINHCND